MGVVAFPALKLVEGEVFDGWCDVMDLVNKPVKGCSMRATISFRHAALLKTAVNTASLAQ